MIRVIVCDIEGTTSSLSFVKDVLFPYARTHLKDFVQQHRDNPQVQSLLQDARGEAGGNLDDEGVIQQMIRWIDEDKKITPLKSLQGLIWEHGYRAGDFTGHLYQDAFENLSAWHKSGYALYIFSSGSVYAQKLLFGHTDYGDLTSLFSGYFDTHIGQKRDVAAYQVIITDTGAAPDAILFLSDIREELDAARQAGMKTGWLVREGKTDPGAAHPQFGNFDEVSRYFQLQQADQ